MVERIGEAITAWTRPLVTVMLASTLCYGFIIERVSADQFVPLAAMIFGFWFQNRADAKATEAVANQAAAQVVAATVERRKVAPPRQAARRTAVRRQVIAAT